MVALVAQSLSPNITRLLVLQDGGGGQLYLHQPAARGPRLINRRPTNGPTTCCGPQVAGPLLVRVLDLRMQLESPVLTL